MIVGDARSLLKRLGKLLERLARDKHSSLLRKFVIYGQKKFENIGFWLVLKG